MKSVKDIEGPWKGEASTGLLQRCKENWETPLNELEDIMVVTYLNQRIALNEIVAEAKRRLDHEQRDDSELYDGQLAEALKKCHTSQLSIR